MAAPAEVKKKRAQVLTPLEFELAICSYGPLYREHSH